MGSSRRRASLAALSLVAICAACSSPISPAASRAPVAPHPGTTETALERRIADFAHEHPAVTGVGLHARCDIVVLQGSGDRAYLEALCSATTRLGATADLGCVPNDATAVDTAAVADLAAGGRPVGLHLDDADDDAYDVWLTHHFPSSWRTFEDHGPRYGKVMQRRLLAADACNT